MPVVFRYTGSYGESMGALFAHRRRTMSKLHQYVFVLWADRFEEISAAIFVTELREAGLRVKLVSLAGRRTPGAHGLALVPDLTLEKALPLASRAVCVVIPCSSPDVRRLENDPRLRDFFCLAQANNATFVMGQSVASNLADLELLPPSTKDVTVYPGKEDLIEFARDMAGSLSTGG